MKTNFFSRLTFAAALVAALSTAPLQAAETNTSPKRIGIYDSRAVAYAWFWSGKQQKEMNGLMQSARAAKAAGDTNRFNELATTLRRHQEEMHREVFSTAPATKAMAAIQARLPEIQKAAGVSALVSKWDEAALKQHHGAEKVDVTDSLVGVFITPTAQQQKVISEMKKVTPLSLDECNELIRKGEI